MKIAMLTTDARECFREYDKPSPYFGAPQEALFQAMPGFPGVELHVISCWQKPMAAPAKLAPNVWFHGLLVPKLGWMRTGFQGCIRTARHKIRQLKPDLVHGQGTERDCAISAIFSGFPNVVTIHGNMNAIARLENARFGSYMWGIAMLEDFTLKRTDGVFCNSAYTEALVKPRTRRTWRVDNPIRTEFFSSRTADPRRDRCILLNVGVISERKRQLEVLNLASTLHARGFEFELHFIGRANAESAYASRFFEQIRIAEKAGYARYLGTKGAGDLVECFDRSHGMIHFPSEEAFGLVVAEGLARNVKFFGSNVGGIMEVVQGAEGAELLEANDWAGLTAAIQAWIEDGFPQPRFASDKMRERYHPQVIMGRHISIYQDLLTTHPSRRPRLT